jgi:hypothetical protein
VEAGVIEVAKVESFGPVARLDDPAAESSSIGWDVRCAAASGTTARLSPVGWDACSEIGSALADSAAVGWDACINVGSCVTDDAVVGLLAGGSCNAGPSVLDNA